MSAESQAPSEVACKLLEKIEDVSVGMRVEAKDSYGKWFCAKIVEKDEETAEVVVHFDGWSSRYDEIVHIRDGRLRHLSQEQLEKKTKARKPKALKVGDRVQAKWQDGRMYFGRVLQLLNQMAVVLFDDGVQYTTPITAVRKRNTDPSPSGGESSNVPFSVRGRKRRLRDDSASQPSTSPPSSPLFAPKRALCRRNQIWETDDSSCTESDMEEGSSKFRQSDSCISSDGDLRPPQSKRGKRSGGLREPYKLRRQPVSRPSYAPSIKRRQRSKGSRSSGGEVSEVKVEGEEKSEELMFQQSTCTSDEDVKIINAGDISLLCKLKVKEIKQEVEDLSAADDHSLYTAPSSLLAHCATTGGTRELDVSWLFCEEKVPSLLPQLRRKLDFLGCRLAQSSRRSGEEAGFLQDSGNHGVSQSNPSNTAQKTGGGSTQAEQTALPFSKSPSPSPLSLPASSTPPTSLRTTPSLPSTSTTEPPQGTFPLELPVSQTQPKPHPQAVSSSPRKRSGSNSQPSSVNTRFRAQTAFENSKKGKRKERRQGKVAPKELVIMWDHNEFKCQHAGCTKSFRKQSLLQSHMKHYHNILQTPPLKKGKPAKLHGDKVPCKSPHSPTSPSSKSPNTPNSMSLSSSLASETSHHKTPPSPTPTAKKSKPQSKVPHVVSETKEGSDAESVRAGCGKSPKKATQHKHEHPKPSSVSGSGSTGGISMETPTPSTSSHVPLKSPSTLTSELVPTPSKHKFLAMKKQKDKARDNTAGNRKGEAPSKQPQLSPLLPSSSAASLPLQRTGAGPVQREDEGRGHGMAMRECEPGNENVASDVKISRGSTGGGEAKGFDHISRSTSPSSEANDDVVHCVCGDDTDEGFMIQCEQCLCWQHGDCIGVRKDALPEKYLCCFCTNPPGLRRNKKYLYDLQWYCDGTLPSLPEGPKFPCPEATLKCHALLDRLHQLRNISHSSKVKLQAARDPNHAYLRQWSKECATLDKETLKNYLIAALEPVAMQAPEKTGSVEQEEEKKETTECSGDVKGSAGRDLKQETGGDISTDIMGATPLSEGVVLTNGEGVKSYSKISDQPDRESTMPTESAVGSHDSVKADTSTQAAMPSSQSLSDTQRGALERLSLVSVSQSKCTSKLEEASSKEESLAASQASVLDSKRAEPDFTSEFGLQEMSVFALNDSGGKLPPKQAQTQQKIATSDSPTVIRSTPLPPIPSLPLLTQKKPLQASTQSAFKPVIVSVKQGMVTPPPTPGSSSSYHPITPTCTSSQLTSLLTSPISSHPQSLVTLAAPSITPPPPPRPPSPVTTSSVTGQTVATLCSNGPFSSTTCSAVTSNSTRPVTADRSRISCVTQLSKIKLTPNTSTNPIFEDTAASLASDQVPQTSAPVLLNDFAEAFVKGDTTNWFKRMLLLSHIESVQDDILGCVEQMERELDKMQEREEDDDDGLDSEDTASILANIQSTLEQMTSFQQIVTQTH